MNKPVIVVLEEAFVTLDDGVEALIAKYNLVFTQRKSAQEGTIARKEFEIERDTTLNVADDFINAGFCNVRIIDKNEIAIEQ